MRSNPRNILYVPNPHAEFFDKGLNWVVFPIMTVEQMVNWKGGPYHVAIFVGEKKDGGTKGDSQWVDGQSKKTAKQAEQSLFSGLDKEKGIEVCSTKDLNT